MRTIPVVLGLALAACGPSEEELKNDHTVYEPEAAATQPAATSSAEGEMIAEEQQEAANSTVPPAFDWTGTYAASPALCTGGRWRFSRDKVVTDGETSCRIQNVAEGEGRTTLTLACVAEGTETDETWVLTPTGPDGFRVDRDMGAETVSVNLQECR